VHHEVIDDETEGEIEMCIPVDVPPDQLLTRVEFRIHTAAR
jgi:hypothetical protein